ncbi:MAG: hypothetical protein Q9181_000970 [Wetmoreana brouardii]
MCGILFSYSGDAGDKPSSDLLDHLSRRGPDQIKSIFVKPSRFSLTFVSTVLSLRGQCLVQQPLQDPLSGSLLCWNGEAWRINGHAVEGNDAVAVFDILVKATAPDASSPTAHYPLVDEAIVKSLHRISGPYAFIFYHASYGKVYYGRDVLGRRSLLRSQGQDGSPMVSSVCCGISSGSWTEVEADGIYVIELPKNPQGGPGITEKHIPWPEGNGGLKAVIQPLRYHVVAH